MNKLWLLLSVLIIALFVVSCAPKESAEGEIEEIDEVEESGALAGQAISGTCKDPDAVSSKDVAQVLTNSTTSTNKGKWVDQCQTVNGKIILKEGICIAGKMATWQYACSKQNKLPGDKYECVNGACVNKGTPTCTPNCAGKTCGDDGCGGICGTCLAGQTCEATGNCKTPAPTCAPGATGKNKCYTNTSGTYAKEELYYANCSTYLPSGIKMYCGAAIISCIDGTGCVYSTGGSGGGMINKSTSNQTNSSS